MSGEHWSCGKAAKSMLPHKLPAGSVMQPQHATQPQRGTAARAAHPIMTPLTWTAMALCSTVAPHLPKWVFTRSP